METKRIRELLEYIYEEKAGDILPPLLGILEAFQKGRKAAPSPGISNRDAFLITYGDMISPPAGGDGKNALSRLGDFLRTWNQGVFSYLHILPFHPYSSDDGFSVIDYAEVDPRLGTWDDIEGLGKSFKMTFDFVINHGSVKSRWFEQFLAGADAYKNWYITRGEDYDYKTVVRPRTHPLLSPFQKTDGSRAFVWTTFSADQADYDFSRPEVFLEFVNIFLEYSRRGGRMLRLDAIAYLWKEDGTPCLHHPKTHAMVQLFRAISDCLALGMLILTETNVPHKENIAYFGDGQNPEAHLVYNFALPPLTLHAAISGDAGPLQNWAAALPPLAPGNCFLNFLASHDGVGLTPARGLVDEAAFAKTLEEAQKRGALVSMKSTPAGPVPYELNCSWADMAAPESLGDEELAARAFLTSYAIALAMPGLPALYFHSWTGSRAWKEGPARLGYNRAINREKPALDALEAEIGKSGSFRNRVHQGFKRLFEFRAAFDAFMPQVLSHVLKTDTALFALVRGPDSRGGGVCCVHNFSSDPKTLCLSESTMAGNIRIPPLGEIPIAGHSLIWLAFDTKGLVRAVDLEKPV
jgi:sucrose phosphorylase